MFKSEDHREAFYAGEAGSLEAPTVFVLMDVTCPQCTCGGVLRGTGNQKVGAIVNAIGYYVIGLPIGIALMFAAKLGVIGKPNCGKTGQLSTGPGDDVQAQGNFTPLPRLSSHSCTLSEGEWAGSG